MEGGMEGKRERGRPRQKLLGLPGGRSPKEENMKF